MAKSTRPKLIVMEGLPASGKTELANLLVEKFDFKKVNESLGKLGGKNLTTDQVRMFDENLGKYRLAMKCKENCVIDRGYPSLLCWDYCAEKLGYANDLREKTKWVDESLQDGRLFEPDFYIYLDISPEISLKRRPRNETSEDVWSAVDGMHYSQEFYNQFFTGEKKIIKIDGTLDKEEVAKMIAERVG